MILAGIYLSLTCYHWENIKYIEKLIKLKILINDLIKIIKSIIAFLINWFELINFENMNPN